MPVKPEIHLKYTSVIWNIYTSEDKFLLLELRDETSMSTYFDLFNINRREYIWQHFSTDEQWRIGLSYFAGDFFVVHEYDQGTLPKIKKLLVYSTAEAKKLNEINNIQPMDFRGTIVKGTDSEGNEIYLDILSGNEVDKDKFPPTNEMNRITFPLTYKEGTDHFTTVKAFVKSYLNKEAFRDVAYCEYNDYIFISFHLKEKLDENWLVGVSKEGNIWLKEQVDQGEKLHSNMWFIWQDHLIFLVGKKELKAIKL